MGDSNSNWYKELKEICTEEEFVAIAARQNSYDDEETLLFDNLEDARHLLDYSFYSGYGGTEGPFFTMWTKDNVYFPACYDGAEWISHVPRNPIAHATSHVGGG